MASVGSGPGEGRRDDRAAPSTCPRRTRRVVRPSCCGPTMGAMADHPTATVLAGLAMAWIAHSKLPKTCRAPAATTSKLMS